ncbi:hypothetical protein RG47T_2109 [Mucilaginibacter polytrichastri]|uniref:Uncharacterized protein n=1 Tax=Mucilaginibacter polytrichastri TaxID=1302689 RepID=A0A1Q5ZY14_9SPHI|nr:hypothetical protein RG47T_2109 [Mucilaginibacter polytrichastri]
MNNIKAVNTFVNCGTKVIFILESKKVKGKNIYTLYTGI